MSSISYGPTDLSLGAVHKRRWPLGGVKNWSQLLTDSTKKLPIWGRGMSKTSFMDGPLLKGFTKNFSFEDFQNFQEVSTYCGLDLMILVL